MYQKLNAPVSCQIEMTTGCNLDCFHCYNHWRHDKENSSCSSLSIEMIRIIAKELINLGVFHATFTGGEPFLNKKVMFEGIRMLMEAGIFCDINSNLTLITKEDADLIVSMGVGGILTSVASPKHELHDKIMCKPGSLKKTLNGIEIAQKSGLTIAASMVVTKLNIHDVYETGKFLHSIGVNQFYATKASPPVNAKGFEEYLLSSDELIFLLESLNRLKKDFGIDVGALECYPLCSYVSQKKYSFMSSRKCSAGVTTCSIGSNGDVRACSHDDKVYGSMFSNGLLNSWDKMSDWRDGSILPQVCKECKFFPVCSGGCRVDAKCINGAKNKLDPYADEKLIDSIILSDVESFDLDLNVLSSFSINSELRFRKEDFCFLCANPSNIASPSTISFDSFDLVQDLGEDIFTVGDIMSKTELSEDDSVSLCRSFVKDSIFIFNP